ncbi:MAG: NAD-dependent DNA ligase LigA, partial [Muribaculaceae bacterium]|nr:NAD-dependent DNA ligase LigA [Muribaculaceae bacterium]
LERIGEKSAQRILDGIAASKLVPFERVIYALSIPNVGETTAKRLASYVKSMERLLSMSETDLTNVPDVGPIIAKSIFEYLSDPICLDNIRRLKEAGVQMSLSEDKLLPGGDALNGKTIVISGTFTHHSRDEYKDLIEREGGKNSGSISKKTSFVLAGENMGPSKKEKCEKMGIPMVSEDEFLKMLNK